MAEPLPICYLNGSLLPLREARISPLDRSFLFGDGVYEVIAGVAASRAAWPRIWRASARSLANCASAIRTARRSGARWSRH